MAAQELCQDPLVGIDQVSRLIGRVIAQLMDIGDSEKDGEKVTEYLRRKGEGQDPCL